jgi:hypothetical protein
MENQKEVVDVRIESAVDEVPESMDDDDVYQFRDEEEPVSSFEEIPKLSELTKKKETELPEQVSKSPKILDKQETSAAPEIPVAQETSMATETPASTEEPPTAPVAEPSDEDAKAQVAKKFSKQKKESEKKKKKREEYRRRKLEAAKNAEGNQKAVEETAPAVAGSSTSEPASSPSSSQSTSPKVNGDESASSPESRDEDISAKESVLGALGLQSTRVAQQERPKVPKLKLVVRPTPAKKKGHRSETGNEKTYAICHEV